MESSVRIRVAKTTGLMFGVAGLVGMTFFELRTGLAFTKWPEILIAYFLFLGLLMLFGFLFSGWYVPQTGFVVGIIVPIIVLTCSAILSGVTYSLIGTLFLANETGASNPSIFKAVGSGSYLGILLLSVAWPVLVPAVSIVSIYIWKRFGRATERGAG